MRKSKMKRKAIWLLALAIVVQTIVYIKVGIDKTYIHMDEAYSLGLASYDKVEIQDSADFYDTWHNGGYYEDYLAVNDDERGDLAPVYNNQRDDVHPPLYYLFLRLAMEATPNRFSKWGGIILNIVIYALITVFTYLVARKLLGEKDKYEFMAVILAFVSSITLAALTNVAYIRMYALATLNIMMITYLHILLYEKYSKWKLLGIGAVALVGSLTHYFFLFYLATLFVVMVVHYGRRKEWRKIGGYVATLAVAGVVSLLIFPYSVQHMFFGYRGDGVITKLTDVANYPAYFDNIRRYFWIIQTYIFNHMLIVFGASIVGIYIYRFAKKIKTKIKYSPYLKLMVWPVAVYTMLVAVSSPWIELRYMMPVCAVLFLVVIYWLRQLMLSVMDAELVRKILYGVLALTAILPIVVGPEPQVVFSDKKEIVQQVQGELNVPTVFWFNANENRFLDDILLFSLLDESYVAKNAELSADNILKILAGRDLSRGILVFINGGQENDAVLEAFVEATELESFTHLKRMNACDIYYLW